MQKCRGKITRHGEGAGGRFVREGRRWMRPRFLMEMGEIRVLHKRLYKRLRRRVVSIPDGRFLQHAGSGHPHHPLRLVQLFIECAQLAMSRVRVRVMELVSSIRAVFSNGDRLVKRGSRGREAGGMVDAQGWCVNRKGSPSALSTRPYRTRNPTVRPLHTHRYEERA